MGLVFRWVRWGGEGRRGGTYFAVEGAGVGDVFLGGVGVDWGVLVGWGLGEVGGRMCLRSVRLFGLFCEVVRMLVIGEVEGKGRYRSGLKVPSVSGMENCCQFGVEDVVALSYTDVCHFSFCTAHILIDSV